MSPDHSPAREQRHAPSADPDALLDKYATSDLLSVVPKTLEKWRRDASGPPFIRISPTCVRYRRRDVLAWVEARCVA